MTISVRKLNPSLLILVLLLLSAALRFYDLGSESLWFDEISTWHMSDVPSVEKVVEDSRADVHPPGYQLVIYYVMKIFGDSESALRMPSAIFGILSIWMIFLLGKKLYSAEAGLLAAAILTLSYEPIYYSQEARSYSLLLLLALVSSYFFIELVSSLYAKNPVRKQAIIGYILAAVATCYTHYFGLLFIALQGLFGVLVLFRNPAAALRLSGIYLVVVIFYAPWLPSMLQQLKQHHEFWIQKPSFFGMTESLFMFSYKVPTWFAYVLLMPAYLVVAFRLGVYFTRSRVLKINKQFVYSDILLCTWIIAPFVESYAQSKLLTPVMTTRNLIIVLPAIYLLLSGAIFSLPWKTASKVWALVLIIGIGFATLDYPGYFTSTKNEEFRQAVEYIVKNDNDIPVVGYTKDAYRFNYYFRKSGPTQSIDIFAGAPSDLPAINKYLAKKGKNGFWFIAGHVIPDPSLLSFMNSKYRLVDSKIFKGASVRKYQLN